MSKETYDIIVAGAGHAGCEAAVAAARMGSRVLLITMNMNLIAQMSCNPAMGGIAKGQIVREIDALGGCSGIITDKTMIQFRMLNRSKGPAMWSPRAQSDRTLFSMEWRNVIENTPNLHLRQDTVIELLMEGDQLKGVKTILQNEFYAQSVILTNGTFLNGVIHVGEVKINGGRIGEGSSSGITEQLNRLGFVSNRMKTGTPVRIDGRSLDFSKMIEQAGDENPEKFSFTDTPKLDKQRSCYLVYTNKEVHDILRTGFDKSPMFTGRIQGIGPRYCPSIEDKIERFSDKDSHQLFVEPEGWTTNEFYLNGFSSSLPEEVQYKALKKIPGFENVIIHRPGYAIEYDFFPPTQLYPTLETKLIRNLFFAGQINGTTGYEEAACQGLMAGINAHCSVTGKDPLVLKRSEAYIGVLIDDLVTKGTDEPYRMFTSRAEYRILLRQDNADIRLTPYGYQLGLIDEDRYQRFQRKIENVEAIIKICKKNSIEPEKINPVLIRVNTEPINQKIRLINILLRPQVSINNLLEASDVLNHFCNEIDDRKEVLEEAEVLMKYEGYIEKENDIVQKLNRLEDIKLYPDFDYSKLSGLSTEARQKLSKIKPSTLGQASRISGVSPSDVSVLMIYISK